MDKGVLMLWHESIKCFVLTAFASDIFVSTFAQSFT